MAELRSRSRQHILRMRERMSRRKQDVVKGQGHVVAHNYLAHWHDAIDVATYGNPDGAPGEIEIGLAQIKAGYLISTLRERHAVTPWAAAQIDYTRANIQLEPSLDERDFYFGPLRRERMTVNV